MKKCAEEQFIKDVSNHRMNIFHSEGVYRHVGFRQPNTGNMWFDLVTWPGFLTISGDMGTWTFSRTPDMFRFFRDDKMRINPSYWGEKLQHGNYGGRDGAKVWDEDAFKASLIAHLDNYDWEDGNRAAVEEAISEDVFRQDGKWEMMLAAREFTYQLPDYKFQFDPCDLPDGMVYSFHFIWCLYAIVWGIQKFDNGDEPATSQRQEPV